MDNSIWEDYDYGDWYHHEVHRQRVELMTHLLTPVKKQQIRSCDVNVIYQRRIEQGAYYNLIAEMRLCNESQYFNYMRMTPGMFDILLSHVGPLIEKNSNYRDDTILSGQRLAVTLRFLASGDSMISLSYAFRISPSSVSQIIKETCLAIWDSLRRLYLPLPTVEKFISVAEGFEKKSNFSHCAAAIDGKLVVVQAFSNSGSENYSYKGQHSINLMAACDSNCDFLLVDVGGAGRHSDGGILACSEITKKMADGTIRFPKAKPLTEDLSVDIPYFMVGDEAFPLENYLLRPYPGRTTGRLSLGKSIFNYRLSRARRCIENAFGIMASRFRIFRKPILASEETVIAITLSSVVLHNFIKSFDETLPESCEKYAPPNFFDREDRNGTIVPGEWRNSPNCFRDITEPQTSIGVRPNASPLTGRQVRDYMKDYFLDEGAVTWQRDSVFFGQH